LTNHEVTYEICYVRAPVPPMPPVSKGRGGAAPVMHPRSSVPGFKINIVVVGGVLVR